MQAVGDRDWGKWVYGGAWVLWARIVCARLSVGEQTHLWCCIRIKRYQECGQHGDVKATQTCPVFLTTLLSHCDALFRIQTYKTNSQLPLCSRNISDSMVINMCHGIHQSNSEVTASWTNLTLHQNVIIHVPHCWTQMPELAINPVECGFQVISLSRVFSVK